MLTCKIVAKNETVSWDHLKSVTLPLPSGEATILQDHAELFSQLTEGEINGITGNEGKKYYKIPPGAGVCHVAENSVTIILLD